MFSNLTDSVHLVSILFVNSKILGKVLRQSPRLAHQTRLFFSLGKERRICLRPTHWHESKAVCFGGHESLSIIVRYVSILLSVLDPSSAVFLPRAGEKNMLPLDTKARMQNYLHSKLENPRSSREFSNLPLCPLQESNLQLLVRSERLYPFN